MPAMSDRFDHTLDRKVERKAEAADEATVVSRIELITGPVRRRDWSDDDKVRIIVESLAPGANISAVARRHGLRPQQLFTWRRQARALCSDGLEESTDPTIAPAPRRPAADRVATAPAFAPVVMVSAVTGAPAPPLRPSRPPALPRGTGPSIEIAIGAATVRVGADVEADVLATVLAALARAAS